ncbi:hypothetical protein SRABI82_05111 [Priestia megaterium]|nr:hypothetical protein SRABI82_05111 [Priestia megaterium]
MNNKAYMVFRNIFIVYIGIFGILFFTNYLIRATGRK